MCTSCCHNGTSCHNKGLHISIIMIKAKFTDHECLDVTTHCKMVQSNVMGKIQIKDLEVLHICSSLIASI